MPRGFLLHGPPGCGKTTLVRAAAGESEMTFLAVSGAELYSCYLGEAESFLRQAFEAARRSAPSLLFIDELDAIVGRRDMSMQDGNGVRQRVLSALLTEMDGVVEASGVLVVGATNRPDMLDAALLRPGRFDEIIEIRPPTGQDMASILEIHSRDMPLSDGVDLQRLSLSLAGQSAADAAAVCREAAACGVRHAVAAGKDDVVVEAEHFEEAINFVRRASRPVVGLSPRG